MIAPKMNPRIKENAIATPFETPDFFFGLITFPAFSGLKSSP